MDLARVVRESDLGNIEGVLITISTKQEEADFCFNNLMDLEDDANPKRYQRAAAVYLGAELRLIAYVLAAKR